MKRIVQTPKANAQSLLRLRVRLRGRFAVIERAQLTEYRHGAPCPLEVALIANVRMMHRRARR